MFEGSLIEVPQRIDLSTFRDVGAPVLDQGQEGACTGFGLAAVTNYLLRRREINPDTTNVSPRMFYELARRYDEWPGEDYAGSSARGTMKGWHKHGVCADDLWDYEVGSPGRLTARRASEARRRPLGAYFRVNHRDLVAMHSALAAVEILYATATVHEGWQNVDASGVIPLEGERLGGHAFAIVAFDEAGFWIQNSWGDTWGSDGFALIQYADWLQNGTDVWVARLGVPIAIEDDLVAAATRSAAAGHFEGYSNYELRPHVISLGNDGRLRTSGTFGNSLDDVHDIVRNDFPRVTEGWERRRLLLYAHGGLVGESSALQRVADYRAQMLEQHCTAPGFLDTSLAVIMQPFRCSARAPGGRRPGCGGRGARPATSGCSGP